MNKVNFFVGWILDANGVHGHGVFTSWIGEDIWVGGAPSTREIVASSRQFSPLAPPIRNARSLIQAIAMIKGYAQWRKGVISAIISCDVGQVAITRLSRDDVGLAHQWFVRGILAALVEWLARVYARRQIAHRAHRVRVTGLLVFAKRGKRFRKGGAQVDAEKTAFGPLARLVESWTRIRAAMIRL